MLQCSTQMAMLPSISIQISRGRWVLANSLHLNYAVLTCHNDYLFRMNCPSKNRDNSDFASPELSQKIWTDFPAYVAVYNLMEGLAKGSGNEVVAARLQLDMSKGCRLHLHLMMS